MILRMSGKRFGNYVQPWKDSRPGSTSVYPPALKKRRDGERQLRLNAQSFQ
jgi:hypothetical protein